MAAMGELDQQLEIVRRGYDPHQVQRLVGSLAGELKALAVENAALREQLAALQGGASPISENRLEELTRGVADG